MRRMSGARWFTRRQVGFGYRPATWQGWAVTAVAVGAVVTVLLVLRKSAAGPVAALVVAAAYFGIAALLSRPGRRPSPPTPGVEPAPRVAPVATPPAAAPTAGPMALVVDHLTKRFGERTAFEDVSFSVAPGEVFGFLGPNGAGKTTMVRALGTLIAPTSGSAVVAGIPLSADNGTEIRQRISIMPENPGLYLRLTVVENLQLFAGLYGLRKPAARIDQALEAVNLGARGRDYCGSLSKGLRQRVGLARALLNDPAVMFLDEPTSGLDPVAAREVHDLINGLRQRGVTVFLTTHRLDEAERLCDRVAILNTRLRSVGRTDELRATLFSRSLVVETAAPLDAPDGVFATSTGVESWRSDQPAHYLLTVTDPRAAAPAVTRALVAAGADVVSIAESRHSLEDVYLELIDEDPEAARR
jgi:ABC-2 type transport system ATP-binding protein